MLDWQDHIEASDKHKINKALLITYQLMPQMSKYDLEVRKNDLEELVNPILIKSHKNRLAELESRIQSEENGAAQLPSVKAARKAKLLAKAIKGIDKITALTTKHIKATMEDAFINPLNDEEVKLRRHLEAKDSSPCLGSNYFKKHKKGPNQNEMSKKKHKGQQNKSTQTTRSDQRRRGLGHIKK